MKLKKEDAAERAQFMFNLFTREPTTSIPQANKIMKSTYGSQMNSQKAYALRRSALAQLREPKKNEIVEAARTPMQLPGHPDLAVLPVHGDSEGDLLEKSLDALRAAGLTTLKVVHRKPDYVLVTNI